MIDDDPYTFQSDVYAFGECRVIREQGQRCDAALLYRHCAVRADDRHAALQSC